MDSRGSQKHPLDETLSSSRSGFETRSMSDIEAVAVELISGLFILIGLGAFSYLFVSINSDPTIQAITRGELEGSFILAFLDGFGIVTPVLVIVLGWIIIRLGGDLRRRHITPARWAQVALIWLIVAVIVVTVNAFLNGGRPELALTDSSFHFGQALLTALPFVVALAPLVIALPWLSRMIDQNLFEGEETLTTRDTRMAWNLLIPTLALLVIVAARPLEETFITSLTDKRFAGTQTINFVGLDNYTQLLGFRLDNVGCRTEDNGDCTLDSQGSVRWELIDREILSEGYRPINTINLGGGRGLTISATDADFIGSVGNTIFFTVVSVSIELVLGLFIAMVVNSNFAGRGLMRAAMLVPWAIPTVISARLWEIMLRDNQSGIINKILVDVGLVGSSQAWLANPDIQLWSLILVDVWKTAPFMALLLLAGLQTVSADLYEAASVDGANPIRQFFSITLPLLRPTIAVALVFRTLDALRAFDVFNVLLGRRKLSMATYNYETLVQNQDGGYASAIGVVIFILIFIFAVIYVRTLGVETE